MDIHVAAILPPERNVDVRRRLLVEDLVASTGSETHHQQQIAQLAGRPFSKTDLLSERVAVGPQRLRQCLIDDRHCRGRVCHRLRRREFAPAQHRQPERTEVVTPDDRVQRRPPLGPIGSTDRPSEKAPNGTIEAKLAASTPGSEHRRVSSAR
ncbi:MAG: hypothetical protein CL477_11745 [Acidobacteria bacterium]|nr:hypothetical protein [Acidobacteriota bacterium]